MLEIFKLFVLAMLLLSGNAISGFIGALLEAFVNLSMRIPYIGRIIKFLIFDFIKLVTVSKLVSWCISSSGVLLGFLIFSYFYGISTEKYEYLVILIISLRAVINILFDMVEFKIQPYTYAVASGEAFLKAHLPKSLLANNSLDELEHQGVSRSVFVSMYLPKLFRLLISIGMVYFSLANMGFIEKVKPGPTDLVTCMMSALSFIPLNTKVDPLFTGTVWTFCNVITAFLVFFWSLFFISAAQSMFFDEAKLNPKEAGISIYQETTNENFEITIENNLS